jgi:hypothetical protein
MRILLHLLYIKLIKFIIMINIFIIYENIFILLFLFLI